MDKDPITQRIVDQVFALIKSSPTVTIAQLERECLGKKPGYLRWARANDALRLSHLSQILQFLGVPPGDFFRVVFTGRADRPDHGLLRIEAHAREVSEESEPAHFRSLRRRFLGASAEARGAGAGDRADVPVEPDAEILPTGELLALDIAIHGRRSKCEWAARLAERIGLAQATEVAGDFDEAARVMAAIDTAGMSGYALGSVAWVIASIDAARGDLAAAEHGLLEALYCFWQHPYRALAVAQDLLLLVIGDGRVTEACRLARSLARFEPEVRDNPVLHALLVGVLRRASHDGLTLPFLRRTERLLDVAIHPDRAAAFQAARARVN